jgi:6,7-dimethyl-8-ribityllumazine synthase|tara:strand:- start:325 stop:738 length:414 start_codon:yes stop_codon:yes gene_type:complete
MKEKKILIVFADFYKDISSPMLSAVEEYNFDDKHEYFFEVINVPGVFEIPVTIARYMDTFDGFVALGCVIKGKTPHFDFISSSTTDAIMKLSIENKKPIGNGIITCLNKKQAKERISKGIDALNAVIRVLSQREYHY